VEGATVRGRITYPGYEHLTAEPFSELRARVETE
jgi:hypothetical protein